MLFASCGWPQLVQDWWFLKKSRQWTRATVRHLVYQSKLSFDILLSFSKHCRGISVTKSMDGCTHQVLWMDVTVQSIFPDKNKNRYLCVSCE